MNHRRLTTTRVPATRTDQRREDEAGFTLIELLIVVAVLGILAAITVISLLSALDRAKQRATMADMRTIGRAIEAYHVDNGHLPDDAGGMAGLAGLLIPYQINVVPQTDHWRNAYTYTRAVDNYSLESFGKDGISK